MEISPHAFVHDPAKAIAGRLHNSAGHAQNVRGGMRLQEHAARLSDALATQEHGRALERMGVAHGYGLEKTHVDAGHRLQEISALADADVRRTKAQAKGQVKVIQAQGAIGASEHLHEVKKLSLQHGHALVTADQAHSHRMTEGQAGHEQKIGAMREQGRQDRAKIKAAAPISAGPTSVNAPRRRPAETVAPSEGAAQHLKAPTLGSPVKVGRAEIGNLAGQMGANKVTGRPKPSGKKSPNVSPQFSG